MYILMRAIGHIFVNRCVAATALWAERAQLSTSWQESSGGAFDSAKNHKRQCRQRQSATAKREKSQTPKFV